MGLKLTLQDDVKKAMLARDNLTRDTLRMVLATIQNREQIELGRDLNEEEALAVVMSAVKSRMDSLSQFDAAGRKDLADKERGEIEVLRRYLPRQRSPEETRTLLANLAKELGVSSRKDAGRVMKELMVRHKGEVDGKLAQTLLAEVLAP